MKLYADQFRDPQKWKSFMEGVLEHKAGKCPPLVQVRAYIVLHETSNMVARVV